MIHYTTTNNSFVKMSMILEEMGIKNNKFMLELLDKDLLNIDPFSENLTVLQKAKITREIINNPWYYYRELVRIPAGGGLVRFELHRGTMALIWVVINNISTFLVWPRQTYKTISMCCIYSHLFYWGSIHNKMCFIAHEDSIVKKNLQGVKDIRDNLPEWLNLYDSKNDRDNEKEMFSRSSDNRITCRAPARNPDAARKAGRGLTTPVQWFDEIAFTSYIPDMYDSISFAYSQASRSAKENGSPYHQIMTTTSGFLNTDEGRWAYNFLNSCADFTETFYDMDIEVVKTIIENGSASGFLDLSYMYYDLGKDENYLEEQKKRLVNSLTPKDTLDREVLNRWKDISTEHPLTQERIEKLIGLWVKPNDHIIINDTYSMRIYVDINTFDWNKPLIGALDIGGNLKQDFSALVVIDPTDFSVIGVLRTNSQSTTLFAFAIITIMKDLCKGMILFPERNYNSSVIDSIVYHLPNSKRRVYHEDEDRAGLFNSKKVRPILFNMILRLVVDEHGSKIRDRTIINEIEGLIRTRSGRIDHKPGNHDDTLVAYLLAVYFLLYVEDVGKYIDKSLILKNCNSSNMVKTSDPAEITNKKKINRLMGDSYMHLMENNKNINSLDDIANIMMDKMSSKIAIESSIQSIDDSDDIDFEEITDSDNMDDIRSSIDKVKMNNGMKTIENTKIDNSQDEDFKSVFGNRFKNEEFKIFGW